MILRRTIRLVCLTMILSAAAIAAPAYASELADVAAAMKPGTWAELKTRGYDDDLLQVQNHYILEYTDTAVWDPVSRQVLFVGQGHYSAVKFITYGEATNEWTLMPTPTWWTGDPKTGKGPIGHAYNNNALDPAKSILYLHQSATRLVHRYDIAKAQWSTLPEIEGAQTGHGTALCWFPDRHALARVYSGAVHFYDDATGAWSLFEDKVEMGPYHNLAKYNPVERTLILGAGNGSKTLQRMDAQGNVTPLADAPFIIRISSTVVAVDPVTGDVLAVNMEERGKFYALGQKTNKWRALPDAPIRAGAAAPIGTYGVTMFLSHGPAKVYLYKHQPDMAD